MNLNYRLFWLSILCCLCAASGIFALPANSVLNAVDAQATGDGKMLLTWGLPAWAETGIAGLEDNTSGTSYPIAVLDRDGKVVNRLLGYRVLKNGRAIGETLLTQRYFMAAETGYYEVESVYENGETDIAAIGPVDMPTIQSGDRALSMDLTAVIQDSFPRVRVRTEIRDGDEAVTGLPLDSFHVWEDDQEMTLLEHCFVDYSRPVDVIFVLDLSRSMEPRIQRVSQTIEAIVDSLPETINARFGIVRYGLNTNGAQNTPPGWTRFPGSPTHENKDSLYSAARARQRMDSLTLNTLTGGQEPAYQAILSAIRQTAWRINSERYIILVSDENNDSCRISPPISPVQLVTELSLRQIRFMAWCNYNTVCECFDNCPQSGRCDTLYSFGCLSGFTHFSPLALLTGGETVPLENDFLNLWSYVRSRLLSTYDLCYDSPTCCENGNVHQISAQVNWEGQVAGDTISYEMMYCPIFHWSEETVDLINGPCQTPFQTLSFCGDFYDRDSVANSGTAILFYSHDAGAEMYPLPTFRPFPAVFPQKWCASIPADSVRGPYIYISARFFNDQGLPVYYPCDTSRICVQAAPQIFCAVPQIWRCEDLVVQVNATDLGGAIVSNQFCYNIPAQAFDTCFTMAGPPPWTVTIPYTRFMYDSICVRASVTDNDGQTSNCGPHCRTPIAHVPQIAHTPPPYRLQCTSFGVAALITDVRGDLAALNVEWQCGDSIVTTPLTAVPGVPNLYSAGLPGQFVNESCTVIYRIVVSDHCFSTVTAGPYAVPAIPHCPVIAHNPITAAFACANIPLAAVVADSGNDLQSIVYGWRCVGDTVWTEAAMVIDLLGVYHGTIPGTRPNPHCDIEYYIRATDACGCSRQTGATVDVLPHAPILQHSPITVRYDCHNVTFSAVAFDTVDGIQDVYIDLWCDTTHYVLPMAPQILPPNTYVATLPAEVWQQHNPGCVITYRITASDQCGFTTSTNDIVMNVLPHAPTIAHDSVSNALACANITLCALIGDPGFDLAGGFLQWKCAGDTTYTNTPLVFNPFSGLWCGTIPGNRPNATCDLDYRFFAQDTCGYSTTSRSWRINVTVNPPTILHNPITARFDCFNQRICAWVYDTTYALATVYADFYCEGGSDTFRVGMPFDLLRGYCTFIPDTLINVRPSCVVTYRITAANTCGETSQTAWIPIQVIPHTPVIVHDSVSAYAACAPITLCWRVNDAAGDISGSTLFWRCVDSGVAMPIPGVYNPLLNIWCATIPGNRVDALCDIFYSISASDFCGSTMNTQTWRIDVQPTPPTILHIPVTSRFDCTDRSICAFVYDSTYAVASVIGDFYCEGSTDTFSVAMPFVPLVGYCTTLPDTLVNVRPSCVITYRIRATNTCGESNQTSWFPIQVLPHCPVILHDTVTTAGCALAIPICAGISDPVDGIAEARLTWRCVGDTVYHVEPLIFNPFNGLWCGAIPANRANIACDIEYSLYARDFCGCESYRGPYTIQVTSTPPSVSLHPSFRYDCVGTTVCATILSGSDGLVFTQAQFACDTNVTPVVIPLVQQIGLPTYCATTPASLVEIRPSCLIYWRATAGNGCGDVTTTAWTPIPIVQHCPVIIPEPVPLVRSCEAVTVCAIITDSLNDLAGVQFEWRCLGDSIVTSESVARLGARHCATIRSDRPDGNCQLQYRFVATDSCGCRVETAWLPIIVIPHCPVIVPLPADTVFACDPAIVCVLISDSAGDLSRVNFEWRCAGDSLTQFGSVSTIGNRYCGTIPGNLVNTECYLEYQFTAYDSCGCVTYSGWLPVYVLPHCPLILPLPADTALACFPTTVCANIVDIAGDLSGIAFEWRCAGDSLSQFGTVSAIGSRYCGLIPGEFVNLDCYLEYRFTAYDSCGCVTNSSWLPLYVTPHCPIITGVTYPNPAVTCEDVTVCAFVTDPGDDLEAVTLYWVCVDDTTTIFSAPMTRAAGPFCATIDAGILDDWCEVRFNIVATDYCGCATETGWIGFTYQTPPLIVQCATFNPDTVRFDEDAFVCMSVFAPGQGIWSVALDYQTGLCDSTVAAHHSAGHWCATIPSSCYPAGGGWLSYTFTAYDSCRQTDAVTCSLSVLEPEHADLGDLPNPIYPTNGRLDGGPAHLLTNVCWLGATIDREEVPYATVNGDPSDDGFSAECLTQVWNNCSEVSFTVNVSTGSNYHGQTMYLAVWNDLNGDGDFMDEIACPAGGTVSEWIVPNMEATPGLNIFSALVHNTTATGQNYIRVRLSTEPFTQAEYVDSLGQPRRDGEVEDYMLQCASDACCFMCEASYATLYEPAIIEPEGGYNLVLRFENDGYLHLYWQGDPAAQYYNIYRGAVENVHDAMEVVGSAIAPTITWVDSTPRNLLPQRNFYQIVGHGVQRRLAVPESDCARWEMNENAGDWTYDVTGNGNDAWRPTGCAPSWGLEDDADCYRQSGFLHFPGYIGSGPTRCEAHLEVENQDEFYGPSFQLWTRIRLTEEPTVNTGPFYIISNNSFGVGGGFALRVDPSWFTRPDGTREYHNRLTAMVWDRNRFGLNNGGWWTIQSAATTPSNPTRGSLPLNEWACVCLVVNGPNSMILVDEQIYASGNLDFDSYNNDAPLIIGAGYRHDTHPIEYPFRGDIDCMRLTCVLE